MFYVSTFVTFERSKVTKNLLLSKPHFLVRLLNRRHPCRQRVANWFKKLATGAKRHLQPAWYEQEFVFAI